ncbi:ARM repeat superfamily protein [Quillaja saponaria]|nr:ARM repeat superfamily protein [Quillaja saponaria]
MQKVDCEEKLLDVQNMPHKVSDSVAEGVVHCLQELLRKCHLKSVDQMVVLLKKLTYGALLSPSEASEEFREGIVKCFRELLLNLYPCTEESCSCKNILGFPSLCDSKSTGSPLCGRFKCDSESGECLLAFLRSQTASAAVGHWLSLLLKVADTEAARGHRGSARLRIEAFITVRVLVSKIGTADALAFFLPGVVSQFAKVLHSSKTMTSGAAGSVEAVDQAIRSLAEYLMIVLDNDSNRLTLDDSDISDFDLNKDKSTQSFLEELRHLPLKAHGQNSNVADDINGDVRKTLSVQTELKELGSTDSGKKNRSLLVNRDKVWTESTSEHVNKLLNATFPHICVHRSEKVRQGLLAAIQGLLLKCQYTMKDSRQMLLECLCLLVVDESEDLSALAQEFLENLFSRNGDPLIGCDVAKIFSRLVEKLPKVVLGVDESLAVSHAQQLLVIIYYSGPQLVVDYLLQSPITAARFLDVFAACLTQNSVFSGSLEKLISARPSSSAGFLPSIAELNSGTNFTSYGLSIMDAAPSEIPKALAGILRLVGVSLVADSRSEGLLSLVTDILLGYFRKLVSELRIKDHMESWQYWYNKTGSGQLLRQASTAACMLNEMIFGLSDQAVDNFARLFNKSGIKREGFQGQSYKFGCAMFHESLWKISSEKVVRTQLIDCIGGILHEYLSPEVWNLPVDHRSARMQPDVETEDVSLHFFQDNSMLHEVIIDGIGIYTMCIGGDFSSSGYLHSSLYLLLENLSSLNFQVRNASDAVLHLLSATSGYPTVGDLVLGNADYVIDSLCRQLRHLDLNADVPNVLAAMLSYVGVAHKILPLLEEPMRSVSLELEILGRHQHPNLTIPFLKAVAEIIKASKHEACSLPSQAKSYATDVRLMMSEEREESTQDQWESILFKLNDSRRYRGIVGSVASSCITAATPLLASLEQAACLVALDIVEDGTLALAKVEEAYKHEKETKEAIEEALLLQSFFQLKDNLDATEGADENRLLPAINKIWPFLVVCVQNRNPVVVRRCLNVVTSIVQLGGGNFFSRRFLTDGSHFWKLLNVSPFQKKPNLKDERTPLQLPYRSSSIYSEDSVAEFSSLKVQIAVLNMISDLCQNKSSATALEVVLKKLSGMVVGIAFSGISGLHDASLNALHGIASIDPDLVWLLLADVYYSVKKTNILPPPASDLPEISQVLPPPKTPDGYLYVQYGGQTSGFDIDLSTVEIVFSKLHSRVFVNQMYI